MTLKRTKLKPKSSHKPSNPSSHPPYSNSKLSLTHFLTCFLNSAVFSLHSLAASGFAGLSSFGLLSIEMTDSKIVSGVCTGDQRSAADS